MTMELLRIGEAPFDRLFTMLVNLFPTYTKPVRGELFFKMLPDMSGYDFDMIFTRCATRS